MSSGGEESTVGKEGRSAELLLAFKESRGKRRRIVKEGKESKRKNRSL